METVVTKAYLTACSKKMRGISQVFQHGSVGKVILHKKTKTQVMLAWVLVNIDCPAFAIGG
jgi:hypothetical protein